MIPIIQNPSWIPTPYWANINFGNAIIYSIPTDSNDAIFSITAVENDPAYPFSISVAAFDVNLDTVELADTFDDSVGAFNRLGDMSESISTADDRVCAKSLAPISILEFIDVGYATNIYDCGVAISMDVPLEPSTLLDNIDATFSIILDTQEYDTLSDICDATFSITAHISDFVTPFYECDTGGILEAETPTDGYNGRVKITATISESIILSDDCSSI